MDEETRIKEDAEWLRLCIEYGVLTKADAIAWADRVIERSAHPDSKIIDVALAVTSGVQEVLGLLAVIGGATERAAARARFFAELARQLRGDVAAGNRIARTLYRMALSGDAPDHEAEMQMHCFDDDYELVQYAGHDEVEIRNRMLAFLEEYAKRGSAKAEEEG